MKKTIRVVFVIVTFFLLIGVLLINFASPKQYVTTDVADYGNYVGNYDNASVEDFIVSFFPKRIEDSFSDIVYSYRAQKNDTYAFEAYLEFTIEDTDKFQSFLAQHTVGMYEQVFNYDNSYNEYVVADIFEPTIIEELDVEKDDLNLHISYAKIGKILYSSSQQKIIFVALGVYDGGVVTTDFLCTYFERFAINPWEYSNTRGRFRVFG